MTFQFNFLLHRKPQLLRLLTLSLCVTFAAEASGMSLFKRIRCPIVMHPSSPPIALRAAQYLENLGTPPLRFAPPPPEIVARPVASETVSSSVLEPIAGMPEESATAPLSAVGETLPSETNPAAEKPKLLSILPDDTPRELRAEDVIPYFQLPRERTDLGDGNQPFSPAQPASSTLPPSSATYQQK